jgi:cytidylate kinase
MGFVDPYINSQMKHLMGSLENKQDKLIPRPFVTISRVSGAYGMTVAETLAEQLRACEQFKNCPWTVFDKELLKKVIEDHNLPHTISKYFPETPVSDIKDALEELFGLHPSQYTLVHKMGETIFHLARLGHVILVGRGSNIITAKLPEGVHVRLIGSLEKRASHMVDFLKLKNEKDARAYVLQEEKDRQSYIRKYFNKDINDLSLYDLVINTDTVPVDDAVCVIKELVLRRSVGVKF